MRERIVAHQASKPSGQPRWAAPLRRLKQSMADEEKKSSAEEQSADAAPAQKPKSDMMMYIIVGVGALVVTIGVMMGMISGEHPQSADAEDASAESAEHVEEEHAEEAEQETPDIFSELDDLSFLADTQFTDPTETSHESKGHSSSKKKSSSKSSAKNGSGESHSSMSANDSLEALGWLETEKKKIATRSKALDEKAKRLEALERTVNQKLNRVDQVEAARYMGLAKLYNGMKPEQVARMLVKLDNKTIVAILPRMKSAQASKILGMLPASRGARISQEMITLSGK